MVYTEVQFGKSVIGKSRKVDIMVVRGAIVLAIECKYQSTQGTTDQKFLYALQDLQALGIPYCLSYAG